MRSEGVLCFSTPTERLGFDLRDLKVCLQNVLTEIERLRQRITDTENELTAKKNHAQDLLHEIAKVEGAILILENVQKELGSDGFGGAVIDPR